MIHIDHCESQIVLVTGTYYLLNIIVVQLSKVKSILAYNYQVVIFLQICIEVKSAHFSEFGKIASDIDLLANKLNG